MGTAPGHRQQPTMPNPDRLVVRSLTVLRSLGVPDAEALALIASLALYAERRITGEGHEPADWFQDIATAAYARLGSLHPSTPHQQENHHGDGPSSRTGSTTQDTGCTAPRRRQRAGQRGR